MKYLQLTAGAIVALLIGYGVAQLFIKLLTELERVMR